MADNIELVIRMSEKTYKHILSMQFYIPGPRSGKSLLEEILKSIRTGRPLLEGHGRIKDIDKIEWYGCTDELHCPHKDRECKDCHRAECSKTQVDDIPTIIEADKVEREEAERCTDNNSSPGGKNDQIPDTRVTIKEAAEELQNLAKAGISQEPCDTCGYEEGSIYCKEHCPHEAKIEQEPCEDAISREAAIKAAMQDVNDRRTHGFNAGATRAANRIKLLPPVTPQPKTGRWVAYEVRLPDRTILNYRCSVCGRKLIGYSTETLSEAPFCHCGAKMVEPQERSDKE